MGGGNSAGQAAVYLSQSARKVHLLVRSAALSETMSRYLIQRITNNPSIEMHYRTEIVALQGKTELEQVSWINRATGETSTHDIRHVFIMAGASPRTDWLRGCVALDNKGFILTGRDLDSSTGVGAALGVDSHPSTANAGDQSSWRFCGWRCSLRQREARGIGRGRRSDCHPSRPPCAGRVLNTSRSPGFSRRRLFSKLMSCVSSCYRLWASDGLSSSFSPAGRIQFC